MSNTSSGGRMSPSMRQSIIGLMLLVSFGFLGILIIWIRNISFGTRSYRATIVFPNSGGMTPGTRVAYRGVRIGQVTSVEPKPEGVEIAVEIGRNYLIPSNSRIEATQAGLVGETSIDITPLQSLPPNQDVANPLDPNCEPSLIICNGSILQGEGKLDVNALIRSVLRISNLISDPQVTSAVRSIGQNASNSLEEIAELLEDAKESGGLENLNLTLTSLTRTSDEISSLLAEVRQKGSIDTLNSTLTSVGRVAEEIRIFLAANQSNIVTTLDSISQTSDQIRLTTKSLTPLIQQVEQSELLDNLETVSANTVELTANLRDFSANIDDPETLFLLEKTLNSARTAFENLQKITSDVDELTGNPQFRQDVEKLIRGLSNLTSSTQILQQQVEYDREFKRISSEIAKIKSEGKLAPNQKQSAPNF
ncbi:MAG: MlaD family protein [Xenococcaceae cyanobacterium MO_167.B27]|nr:MlaD family protein [Xenococcaceae cyanobacterium MO_167.B27]